jgi:CDGSH-type Zn-finger protein
VEVQHAQIQPGMIDRSTIVSDPVTIKVRDNGPYLVRGPFKLIDVDGNEFELAEETVVLCRCGHSSSKPFCDATHKRVEFKSQVRAEPADTADGHAG